MILEVQNYEVYVDFDGELLILLGKATAPEGNSECWCYMFNEGEITWMEVCPRDIRVYEWLGHL